MRPERRCAGCDASFIPKTPRQRYCSQACARRSQARHKRQVRRSLGLCPQCGRPYQSSGRRSYCPRCADYFRTRYRARIAVQRIQGALSAMGPEWLRVLRVDAFVRDLRRVWEAPIPTEDRPDALSATLLKSCPWPRRDRVPQVAAAWLEVLGSKIGYTTLAEALRAAQGRSHARP